MTATKLALAASGWLTLLGILILPAGSLPRVLLVFGFVLICPGFAVSGLSPVREPVQRWVLSIALSVSLAIVVSVVLTVLRIDSVALRLGVLALVTTVAVLLEGRRCPRGRELPDTAEETVRP